jgi:hypothetical protein
MSLLNGGFSVIDFGALVGSRREKSSFNLRGLMGRTGAKTLVLVGLAAGFIAGGLPSAGQDSRQSSGIESKSSQIEVNWLYGAFVPKDIPLVPLTPKRRGLLYLRQTYLTYGIYLKTAFFSLDDQATRSPPEWGSGFEGYGKRIGSRYGEFAIQNTLSSGGNFLLGYEPRYDRCRCSGVGPRLQHALMRNFVTYNRTEYELRPQIGLYAGALGAGLISSTWEPASRSLWKLGYQSVITQAAFGSFGNTVGEFAVEIERTLHIKKEQR